MGFQKSDVDDLCINTIRVLSADVVNKANSGHPGKLISYIAAEVWAFVQEPPWD